MKSELEVIINNEIIIKYDRNTRLPGKQREFLDIMDIDMDEGIYLNDKRYTKPDMQQRGKYVAMKLIQAIQANDQGMINAMCAYLANRLPTLNQISAEESASDVTINLNFDESN